MANSSEIKGGDSSLGFVEDTENRRNGTKNSSGAKDALSTISRDTRPQQSLPEAAAGLGVFRTGAEQLNPTSAGCRIWIQLQSAATPSQYFGLIPQ